MQCSYVKHTWIHKCLCELNSKAVCITGFYCHAGWVLVSFHPIGGLLMLELSSARRWWAIPDPRIRLPQGSSFAPLKIHGLVGPPPPEQITALTVEKELRVHPLRLLFYFFFLLSSSPRRSELELIYSSDSWLETLDHWLIWGTQRHLIQTIYVWLFRL